MYTRFIRLVLLPALVLNLLAYGVIITVFEPQAAHAQAYVIGSDPVDGSTVSTMPKRVRIFFDASVSTLSTAILQYVKNGDFVPVQGQSVVSSSDSREIDISIPGNSPQGSYFVHWTAISNLDGHTTYGSIGFNVGASSLGLSGQVVLGPSSSNDLTTRNLDLLGTLSVAWEWLVQVALVFLIGILVTERLVLVQTERATPLLDRVRRQSLPMQWLCLSAMLVGEVVTMLLREVHVTRALYDGTLDFSALFPFLTQTVYGWLWFVRIFLLLLALGLLWWLSRPSQSQQENTNTDRVRSGPLRPQRRVTTGPLKQATEVIERPSRPPVPTTATEEQLYIRGVSITWFVIAALLVCTYALTDTQVTQLQANAMIYNGFSLLAQGIWFGSLAYLGFILLPLISTLTGDSNAEVLAAFLRKQTPYLITAIIVETSSLLFMSEATILQWGQWLNDPYGRALLIRLILVALALLLTLYTLLIVRPRLARQAVLLPVVNADLPARRARQTALDRSTRGLKQLVSLQALLGAGVLLCVALMTFYAPPIVFPNIHYTNPPANSNTKTLVQTQTASGLTVTFQVSPGRVNTTNTITLHINGSNGAPVTNAHVKLVTSMQVMDMGVAQQNANGSGSAYTASFTSSDTFSMSGIWNVRVIIQRAGQTDVTMTFPVSIG